MTRNDYVTELKNGVCRVIFTKKNGEERDMTCTLDMSYVPESQHPKGTAGYVKNEETISVYDMKAEGWRSFKVENIKEFLVQ